MRPTTGDFRFSYSGIFSLSTTSMMPSDEPRSQLLEQLADRVRLVRESPHERLLGRPKDQGPRRPRPRDAKEGGGRHLRRLARYPQALAQAPPRGRVGHSTETLAGAHLAHPCHPRAAARTLGATPRERRRHLGAPLRAVGAHHRRCGLGFDDEPSRAQAGLDLQKSRWWPPKETNRKGLPSASS